MARVVLVLRCRAFRHTGRPMPRWWANAPWADRDRPGIQLLWVSVLVSVLAIIGLLVDRLL